MTGLASLCTADFDVYRSWDITGGRITTGWQVFEADVVPSCDQVGNGTLFRSRDDVSSRIGVRCKGSCFLDDPADNVDELEMHLRDVPLYHWSEFYDLCSPSLTLALIYSVELCWERIMAVFFNSGKVM
jgi:hypothetical protein